MKITKEMFQSLVDQMNRDTSLVINEDGKMANKYPLGWLGKIQDEILEGPDQESAALLSSFIKKNMPAIRQIVMAYLEGVTLLMNRQPTSPLNSHRWWPIRSAR